MLLFALMTLGLPAQESSYPAAPELYAPPVVRPFEPASDFGRAVAQGDAGDDVHRRPITTPVVVEAYRRSYEVSPSDAEVAYEQGVAQAEINADSRSGPLDGRWRVIDPEGRVLLDLVLSDRGSGKPVEGAWSRRNAGDADMGLLATVIRDGETVVIDASVGDRPVVLRLRPAADGWAGTLTGAGRDQTVAMTRPG